jgi:hypothetical protein
MNAIIKKFQIDLGKKDTTTMRVKAERFLGGWTFQGLMTIITIYSLFGDDVRQMAFTGQSDYIFYILSSISLGAFSLEIVLQSILREDYWLGFYFWLDLISTVSLLTDIGWVMNAIVELSSGGSTGGGSNI